MTTFKRKHLHGLTWWLIAVLAIGFAQVKQVGAQDDQPFLIQLEGRGYTQTSTATTPAIFITDSFAGFGDYPQIDWTRHQETLWQFTQGVRDTDPLVVLDIEQGWHDAMYASGDVQVRVEALSDAVRLIERTRETLHKLGYVNAKVLWYTNVFDAASIERSMPIYRAADVVCPAFYVRDWTETQWREKIATFKSTVSADTGGLPKPEIWPVWSHDTQAGPFRQRLGEFRDRTEHLLRTFEPSQLVMYSRRFSGNPPDIDGGRWDTDLLLDIYWRAAMEAHAAAQVPDDAALWFTPRAVEAPSPTRFETAHDWRSLSQAATGGSVEIDLEAMTIDARGGKLSLRDDTIIRNGVIHRGEFHLRGRRVRFENITFTGSMGNELAAAIRSRGDQNDVGDLAVVDCAFSDVRNAIDLAYGCDGVHIEKITGTRYAYLLWAEDSSDLTIRNVTTLDDGVGPRLEHDIRLNRNVLRTVMEGLDLDPGGDWKNSIAWGGDGGCDDLAILNSRVRKSITLGPRPHDIEGPRLDQRVLVRNVTIDTTKMRPDKYTAALVIAPTTDDVRIEGLTVTTNAGKPALDIIERAQGREAGLIVVSDVVLNGEAVH